MTITIRGPQIGNDSGRLTYRVLVESSAGLPDLWFSVPAEHETLVNTRLDAALVALLMPAMKLREDIYIAGPVTDELVWNCRSEVQEILRRVRPELSPIRIEAQSLTAPLPGAPGVATGYSAGVDSYATLAQFLFNPLVPQHLRVTHLLYNNVGSHGAGGSSLFKKRLERVNDGAATLGLPLIDVDSNLDEIFTPVSTEFISSHTVRNSAVAHLLSGGIGHYLYSSGVTYGEVKAGPARSLAVADPLLLPFLSTKSITCQASGTTMDRPAKVSLVAGVEHSYDYLDVCVASTDGTNCSNCWKCQSTMLTLDLLNVLERYDRVFSPPWSKNWQKAHVAKALGSDVPMVRSVVPLYEERRGIGPGLRVRALRHEVRKRVRSTRSILLASHRK